MKKPFVISVVAVSLSTAAGPSLVAAPPPVHPRLMSAQYVALGYDVGDRFVSDVEALRMGVEDHEALWALRALFEKWGRYEITEFPWHAELLVAIRTGRVASARYRAPVGGREPASGRRGRRFDVQFSSPGERLSIYQASAGLGSVPYAPLWQERQSESLSAQFERLRSAVEAAGKRP